jgi:hypothetical protein
MTTTDVMHHTGGKSKPLGMTYVDPRRLSNADFDAFLPGSGLNGPFVADLMSDFLAHERCGPHPYRWVAGRTLNPMLRSRYNDFGRESEQHIRILEELILALGGDPGYVSPSADAAVKANRFS